MEMEHGIVRMKYDMRTWEGYRNDYKEDLGGV